MLAQADRDGKHRAFAEKYEGSDLRRRNARVLAEHMSDGAEVPRELLRELATHRETTNPLVLRRVDAAAGERRVTAPLLSGGTI